MYITNRQSWVKEPAPPEVIACHQPYQLNLSLLGLAFGLTGFALYYINRTFFLHVRAKRKIVVREALRWLSWIFFALFLLYFLQLEYRPPRPECPVDGLLLKGRHLPEFLQPLYLRR